VYAAEAYPEEVLVRSRVLLAVPVLFLACLALAGQAAAAPSNPSNPGATHRNVHVCSAAAGGSAGCDAIRHDKVDAHGKVVPNATPSGYGPSALRSAYALSGSTSGGKTVAIVDAYDDPSAEADLAKYRSTYGLSACTTSNGCFRKVAQNGGTAYPRSNGGWAQEISLDLDMVSATCADCHILLVEAKTSSFANLGAAVNTAAKLGATAISNSYGGSDSSAISAYDHPGIAVTASTGDSGYGVQSPASFKTVVAVGGTSLTAASNARGWTESAWSGAGSGCSTLNAQPSWQSTATTSCTTRASADVSAVADPNTGVAVYDSFAYQGSKGWMVFGGTSASSPIIASVYAMSGNTAGYPASYTWGHASALNDVTTGANGSCPTAAWCTARVGWDGPTGLGTPKGTGGF
jgi:subtilase family serine protease